MKNLKRRIHSSEINLFSNKNILFNTGALWVMIGLLYVNPLYAQYSNSTINGPWRWHSVPFHSDPDSSMCIVFDGNGKISDVLAFFFSTTGSSYTVGPNGAFSGTMSLSNSLLAFTGQLTSQNNFTLTVEKESFVFSRILNLGSLTDTLSGTLHSNSYGQKNIVMVLNSKGQIISATGFTPPVSGSVYADSGMFVGHIRTGEAGPWKGATITGTYTNNTLTGTFFVDAPPNIRYGSVQLVRTGKATPVNVHSTNISSPTFFNMKQNYPNPFNSSTIIQFSMPLKSYVSLKVFDLLGREIETLINEEMSVGNHTQHWHATNIPSGLYLYRLQSGSFTETKKLLLVR